MAFLRARLALIRVDRAFHDLPADLRALRAARRAPDAGHRGGNQRLLAEVAIADPEPFRPDRRRVAALHAARVDHAVALVDLGQSDALAIHARSIAHEAGVEPSSENLEHYWIALSR